jgi:hypothetical protein
MFLNPLNTVQNKSAGFFPALFQCHAINVLNSILRCKASFFQQGKRGGFDWGSYPPAPRPTAFSLSSSPRCEASFFQQGKRGGYDWGSYPPAPRPTAFSLAAVHDAGHRSFSKENGGDMIGGATPSPRPTAFSLAGFNNSRADHHHERIYHALRLRLKSVHVADVLH